MPPKTGQDQFARDEIVRLETTKVDPNTQRLSALEARVTILEQGEAPPEPDPEPPPPEPEPGPPSPDGPTVDVWVAPGELTQTLINRRSEGTVFGLRGGTHHVHEILPKDGQVFWCDPNDVAVLDGQGASRWAFFGSRTGVHLWNLELTRYTGEEGLAAGAVFGWGGSDWTLQNLTVHDCSIYGAGIHQGFRVIGGNYWNNGIAGIAGTQCGDILLDGVTVEANNSRREDPLSATGRAAGCKLTVIDGLIVRNSFFDGNHGPGLWTDINCQNVLVEDTHATDNGYAGFFHEVSRAATFRRVTARGNGREWPRWYGAEILIVDSDGCVVEDSTIVANVHGIVGNDADRRDWGLSNNTFRSNLIDMASGHTGFIDSVSGGTSLTTEQGNVFEDNHYLLHGRDDAFYADWRPRSFEQWQAMGQDIGSTFA